MGDWTKGGTTGHHSVTRASLGGAPHSEDPNGKISWTTAAGRARIGPGEAAAAATVSHRYFLDFSTISGPFRPPHSSFPPFLDPLNSFPWSLFADSSPFESYDENKVSRWLDRVFWPPQRLLDQGNGTDEFLVSWACH